jgi:lipopolysaccharide export system protein LptA
MKKSLFPPASRFFLCLFLWFLPLGLPLFSATVSAQSQAPKVPVHISADRVTIDERKKIHVFEGHVEFTQGELRIRSARLTVQQDRNGFRKGVASGGAEGLARFSHRKTGEGPQIEGEAERLEYEADTETFRLFDRARITHGGDEIRGHFIEYDHLSERYHVRGSGENEASGRVRAVIQPR